MSNKQLYEKENNINKPFFPVVRLEDIIDTISEKSIQWVLNNYNHIYVEWKNNVVGTRLSVPTILRRNGLWITYNNGDRLITEYYIGKNTEIKDKHWQDDVNWEDYTNKLIDGTVEYRHLSESLKQLFNKGNVTNFPDEEDLTSDGISLSFKDREYQPENFSGLGRVILRKNIVKDGEGYKNILTQSMLNKDNTIYIIRYDFTLNGQDITLPDNSYIECEGGSISDGNIIDRAGGLNRVVLKKNIINGKNILTQDVINKENTVYEIRYDFDLNGEEIIIPKGCVLDFQGGSFSNGIINFNYTYLEGKVSFKFIKVKNKIINTKLYFSWFYDINDTKTVIDLLDSCSVLNVTAVFDRDIIIKASEKTKNIIAKCNIDFNNKIISFDSDIDDCYIEINNDEEDYVINDIDCLEYINKIIKGEASRSLTLNDTPNILKNLTNKLVILEYSKEYKTESNIEAVRQTFGQVNYKCEFFYIDEFHNILGDFYNTDFDIEGLQLIISNCSNSNIVIENAIFKAVKNETSYKNGLYISRSNTIIKNIHIDNSSQFSTHFNANFAYNLTFDSITFKQYEDYLEGIYLLLFNYVYNLNIKNFNVSGIVGTSAGNLGSNYVYNVNITNSSINRFDTHYRLRNLFINNSIIGHVGITYHGGGNITIKNSTFITNAILQPRVDFGGDFDGDVILENIVWKYKSSDSTIVGNIASILMLGPAMADIHPNNPDYHYWLGAKNIYIKNLKIEKYDKLTNCIVSNILIGYQNDAMLNKHLPNIYVDNIKFEEQVTYYNMVFANSFVDLFKFHQNEDSNLKNYNLDSNNKKLLPNIKFVFKNIKFPNEGSQSASSMEFFRNNSTITNNNYEESINKQIDGESREGLKILPHYYYYNCSNIRLSCCVKNSFITVIDSEVRRNRLFYNDYHSDNNVYCYNSSIISDAETEGGISAVYTGYKSANFINCVFDISNYITSISNSNLTNAVKLSFLIGNETYTPRFLNSDTYKAYNCILGDNLIKNWYIVQARLNVFNYAKCPLSLVKYYIGQLQYPIFNKEDLLTIKLDKEPLLAHYSENNSLIWWNGEKWVNGEGIDINFNRHGNLTEVPINPNIGFAYFCHNRKTEESTEYGIMIYHKGNNVWIDALGRVVE